MAKIMLQGKIVEIGDFPIVARQCGFKSPEEVTRAARKWSRGNTYMRMDDVIEFFENGGHDGV